MPANWLSSSSDLSRRVTDALEHTLAALARPAAAQRLRRVLIGLFAVWAVLALSQLIWALLPGQDVGLPAGAAVINPASVTTPSASASPVDISRLRSWHLFGEAGAAADMNPLAEPEVAAAVNNRDGIEKGARETRLALKLRGVVASSEDGLGYAVIEYQNEQDIYAVEDKLPLPGQVVLAKVMAQQVVLDNGGTYELLELFDDSSLDAQLLHRPPEVQAPTASSTRAAQGDRAEGLNAAMARTYRDRLYQNPQSLADVVTVSAVRENGELVGYRIAPGKEPEQFEQLGFKPGDLVTSVNGIALNDPANTLRLYQTMRSASEAVFDLQRDEQALTVSVSLGDQPREQ